MKILDDYLHFINKSLSNEALLNYHHLRKLKNNVDNESVDHMETLKEFIRNSLLV